jgi:putative transposase
MASDRASSPGETGDDLLNVLTWSRARPCEGGAVIVRQAYRYELAPDKAQRHALHCHAGAARWAWNWALAVRSKAWRRRGETLDAVALHRLLNRLKRTPRFAWLYQVSKCAPQEALRDLDRAYQAYWKGLGANRRVGFPRFKKRGRCPDSFRLTGAIKVKPSGIVLPRIGMVATKESTGKFRGTILSATCKREADRWYCSLTVEVDRPDPARIDGPIIGIDRGLATLAVCSDGTRIAHPRALARGLGTIRRRARAVTRKQCGSRNRAKAIVALARAHRRVRNKRIDALHKATTALAKTKSVIVVEDLHVAGMLQNRQLARSIADASWAELGRQLTYKCQWYGSRLVVADRWYPSSKTCSACGQVTAELSLSQRAFQCDRCGLLLDRDDNAARNLAGLGLAVAGSSPETINVCGAGSAGRLSDEPVELPAVKQKRDPSLASQRR